MLPLLSRSHPLLLVKMTYGTNVEWPSMESGRIEVNRSRWHVSDVCKMQGLFKFVLIVSLRIHIHILNYTTTFVSE